jgi:hypothetical protein
MVSTQKFWSASSLTTIANETVEVGMWNLARERSYLHTTNKVLQMTNYKHCNDAKF